MNMRFMRGAIRVEVAKLEYEVHERLDRVESILMEHLKLIATLSDGIRSLLDRAEMMDVGTFPGECEAIDAQTYTAKV